MPGLAAHRSVQQLLPTAGDDHLIPDGMKSFLKSSADAGASTRDQDCVATHLRVVFSLVPW